NILLRPCVCHISSYKLKVCGRLRFRPGLDGHRNTQRQSSARHTASALAMPACAAECEHASIACERRWAMKVYGTKEIRNVGIVGHGDVGKTSLASAMLFAAGATNRLGRVDDGSSVTDYDEDEIARKITIYSPLAHCDWNGTKINILDTPGYAAFILDAKAA